MDISIKKPMHQAAAIFALALIVGCFGNCTKTGAPPPPSTGIGVLDEIKSHMAEHFFDKSMLPAISAGLDAIKSNLGANHPAELKRLMGSLGVSHLGFFTKDDLDYYEMLEIYRFAHEEKLKAMFPPDGVITYPGIGIAPRLIDGRYFVAFIYAGTPAAQADILVGDELLSVDGEPYSPISAFKGKIGKTVTVALRRERDGPALEREVAVKALNPMETLNASTVSSAKVIDRGEYGEYRVGYIRLYFCSSTVFDDIFVSTISGGAFASADALVVDMRGRWGGAPLDAAEVFVGGAASVESISAASERRAILFRWNKPVVAVIGPDTRSGLEIMAYSMKKAGIPMVGATTRGAVVAGTTFLLSDGSLLLVPIADILVADGRRIEGVGVAPTMPVDAVLEYSQGVDLQLNTAMDLAVEEMEKKSFVVESDWNGVKCKQYHLDYGAPVQECTFKGAKLRHVYNIIKRVDANLKQELPTESLKYKGLEDTGCIEAEYRYKSEKYLVVELFYEGGVTSIEIEEGRDSTRSKITYSD